MVISNGVSQPWTQILLLLSLISIKLICTKASPLTNITSLLDSPGGLKSNGSVPFTNFPSLINVTIDDLALGLSMGSFSSVDLVRAYLDRIEEVNTTLNAVNQINPDALSIAKSLDDERKAGIVRGPLHGIPLLLKDNIATNDKMDNTAGSYALRGAKVPRDAGVVSKLRDAGAIVLGKTNLSQWANFRSKGSTNGWSAFGGQVYGAYHEQQDPSGSSSGSAVASAVGLALATIGTETDGSIISPSEVNNIVGIKPTVGLTSRSLVIPISQHQDTVGPMARTVKDAAYILSAIAGKDPEDNYTSAIPFTKTPDYVSACDASALQGARIGIPRNGIYSSGSVLDAFEAARETMSSAGAEIVDNADFPEYDSFRSHRWTARQILSADFASDLCDGYLSKLVSNPHGIHNLSDLELFTKEDSREAFPARDVLLWDDALSSSLNNTSPEFWSIYQRNLYLGGKGGILGALEKYKLDALIMPTEYASSLAAIAGYPVVTVPLGFYPANMTVQRGSDDLVSVGPNIPFGLSFLGGPWSEETLISYAFAFEQLTKTRDMVQPRVVPKREIGTSIDPSLTS
ncbi:MAG: hypothetical protein M1825_005267 [Sarcosagium campestre]|nr:MAG: hypothetical protein M1825_005267 [Sarcosagium campestre]